MVHHPAVAAGPDDDVAARLRGYQRHHQDQGWPDIAYHVGIARDGGVFQLRDHEVAGDTFTDYDPTGWLLVLVDGHFDQQDPTEAQLVALAQVLAWASDRHGLDVDAVSSHREHAATTCPGASLQAVLDDGTVQQRAEAYLAGGGVELVPTCDDPRSPP